MILTDLSEIKRTLNIDPADTQEDANLYLYAEWASDLIQEYLNRPDLKLQEWTEYYSGTGSNKLLLNHRPVYVDPAPQVWVAPTGYFGFSSPGFEDGDELTHGSDFVLSRVEAPGKSRSGVLLRVNNLWPKRGYRQTGYLAPFMGDGIGNIKVTYTAGYTVDDLPARVRAACNFLVARIRYLFPLGMEIAAEGYEERSISLRTSDREYLMGLIKPMLFSLRNWKF